MLKQVGRPRGAAGMVREFHDAIGVPTPDALTVPARERVKLRFELISEEAEEALEALDRIEYLLRNRPRGVAPWLLNLAKELADILVVTYGTALEFGIDLDAVLAEVHASNMAKVGGPTRDDGKQLKPEGWTPPDIASVLGVAA